MSSSSSPITSRAPRFAFTDEFIQPPGAHYIDRDDRLAIEATSSTGGTVFRIQARILLPGERIAEWRHDHTAITPRVTSLGVFDLVEGFLLGVDVSLREAASGLSWNYAQVGLARGPGGTPDVFQGLAQGYIDSPYSLYWPGGVYRLPQDGVGFFSKTGSPDPAAGNESSITVPTNVTWRLVAGDVTLVTDGTVINRHVLFRVDRAGGRVFWSPSPISQGANQTLHYQIAEWGLVGANHQGRVQVGWPRELRLYAGDVLTTETINLQAGDDWNGIGLLVEERFRRFS